MFRYNNCFGRLSWPLVRAHLCTLAVSLTFNATWRVPRDGFRYGGLPYGMVLTVAFVAVALPVTLLQLAIGQLSQQDAVGIWRAVPFFKGVGYIRMLVSFAGSAYTAVYLALSIAYLLYTAGHSIPYSYCVEWVFIDEEEYLNSVNASQCLRNTFLSPVNESPEYYLAIGLLITVLWIFSPFVFYSSVKFMKRIMYLVGPLIVILGITAVSCIGTRARLSWMDSEDWQVFTEPQMWFSGVVQALWSCQIAGGYLIVAGDSVYASTNVQWTSLVLICTNIISSWFWLIFWFAVTGAAANDTSSAAVLVQMYQAAEDDQLRLTWPVVVYLTLVLSGAITMLVLIYPVFDRIRRVGGYKWRLAAFAGSLAGAGVSLALLAGNLPALALAEDVVVPLLVCATTVLEILALGFIYGWSNLIEDVEFLISNSLSKWWVRGWWLAAAVIAPCTAWWLADLLLVHSWEDLEATSLIATATVAAVIIMLCAVVTVWKQVQYGICEKLKSSFQPSRHWGPRDPITHYYWLARREDINRGYTPRTRYNRRELGQFTTRPSFLTTTVSTQSKHSGVESKQRSNSDDWIYTSERKKQLPYVYGYAYERKRTKSLDWEIPIRKTLEYKSRESYQKEDNNNVTGFKYSDNIDAK